MEQVFDKLVTLSKKYTLLDLDITDLGYLREKTFDFLSDAKWPGTREYDEDVIFDTIYDLGYKLMDIWFKPVMTLMRDAEVELPGEFDMVVQAILHTYFLENLHTDA